MILLPTQLSIQNFKIKLSATIQPEEKMTQFKLPPNFKPSYIGYKYETVESGQKQETERLNIIGSRISDYLSLIESGNMELSSFQALLLAIELYKTEALKGVSASINEGVSVSGHITTT